MSSQVAGRGAVSVPVDHLHWRPRRTSPLLRLRLLLDGRELDRVLASGADPASSELLAARGAQLTGRRIRTRLANGLSALIDPPSGPAGLSSAIRPRTDLRPLRPVLVALQRRLRSREQLEPRGVAVLKWMLTDVVSPLYTDPDPNAVSSLLRLAAATMTSGSES
jgi:hypothetical protein